MLDVFHGQVAVTLLDENGAPKDETVFVPEKKRVIIKTDRRTDKDASVDGNSYFVYENNDGGFTPADDTQILAETDLYSIKRSTLQVVYDSDLSGGIKLNSVVCEEVKEVLFGTTAEEPEVKAVDDADEKAPDMDGEEQSADAASPHHEGHTHEAPVPDAQDDDHHDDHPDADGSPAGSSDGAGSADVIDSSDSADSTDGAGIEPAADMDAGWEAMPELEDDGSADGYVPAEREDVPSNVAVSDDKRPEEAAPEAFADEDATAVKEQLADEPAPDTDEKSDEQPVREEKAEDAPAEVVPAASEEGAVPVKADTKTDTEDKIIKVEIKDTDDTPASIVPSVSPVGPSGPSDYVYVPTISSKEEVEPTPTPTPTPTPAPTPEPEPEPGPEPEPEPVVNNVTVTFLNGDEKTTVEIPYGTCVTKPTAPVRKGEIFKCWLYKGEPYGFDTPVTADITLVADFSKATYTVTFNDGSDSISIRSIYGGDVLEEPTAPVRSGYRFVGWTLADGTIYEFGTPVYGDLYLTAKFVEKDKFPVHFDTDGGSTVEDVYVEDGGYLTAPTDPVKEGYDFVGWYTGKSSGKEFDFSKDTITGETTLYAAWNMIMHTVTFDSDGGSEVEAQKVPYGKFAFEPEAPVKEGYRFDGWYIGTNIWMFNDPVKTDITLTAKWTEVVTVTFDTKGGTVIPPQILTKGSKPEKPADPIWDEYIFTGWYIKGSSEEYLFSDGLTTDIVIEARWNCTITYIDGDDIVDERQIPYNSYAPYLTRPEREDAEFKGWNVAETGAKWNFNYTVTSAHLKLEAYWEKYTYTITFYPSNAYYVTSFKSDPVEWGDTLPRPEDPTPQYTTCTFAYWATEDGEKYDFDTPVKSDFELTAKWLTTYTVEHKQQVIDGYDHETAETETFEGIGGDLTTAEAKSYTGFEDAQTFYQMYIRTDGSTVVEIKYNRKDYSVSWSLEYDDGEYISHGFFGDSTSCGLSQWIDYDKTVRSPEMDDPEETPRRNGYDFRGWTYLTDDYTYEDDPSIEAVEFPMKMPDHELKFIALWQPKEQHTVTYHYSRDNTHGSYSDHEEEFKVYHGDALGQWDNPGGGAATAVLEDDGFHMFTGWEYDGKEFDPANSGPITEDMYIEAVYAEEAVPSVDVAFWYKGKKQLIDGGFWFNDGVTDRYYAPLGYEFTLPTTSTYGFTMDSTYSEQGYSIGWYNIDPETGDLGSYAPLTTCMAVSDSSYNTYAFLPYKNITINGHSARVIYKNITSDDHDWYISFNEGDTPTRIADLDMAYRPYEDMPEMYFWLFVDMNGTEYNYEATAGVSAPLASVKLSDEYIPTGD